MKPDSTAAMQSRLMRLDRWVNEKNSFGNGNDPITRTAFSAANRLSRSELDSMFEFDWLAKRIVTIPADDATREWISITHDTDPSKAEFITDELKRLKAQAAVREAIVLSRLYGGSLMTLGVYDGQETNMPLNKVRRVEFLHNVDRYLAYPQTFYKDPMDMRFGEAETYQVNRSEIQGSLISMVHETRAIRFDGEYVSPLSRLRNYGWHAPVLQHVYESLRHFGVSNQAGAAVLQDFITKKLKISNLQDLLSTETGMQQIQTRVALMAAEMAIHNIAVYGQEEEFDKMGTPINNLPELMAVFQDMACGSSGIPKSRLFQSESGSLGGDQGKNDLRVHYDNIAAYQKNHLADKIQRIIDVIGMQRGYEPGEIAFTFNPLWQLSEAEDALVRYQIAQTDEIYMRNGVVEPEEVALSRFGGNGITLNDMNIDVERREKYLDELSKQPVELDGTEPADDIDALPNDKTPSKD